MTNDMEAGSSLSLSGVLYANMQHSYVHLSDQCRDI